MTESEWSNLPYSPDPGCSACLGVGFVHPVKENGKADYSRVICCPFPGCLRDSIRAYRSGEPFIRRRGVTAPEQTFETFQPVSGTEEALKYARNLAGGKAQFIWLLLYGGVGNGKTHLCNAIAHEALGRGVDVYMTSAAELFSHLRQSMNDHSTDALIAKFKQTFLLILDDWGVEYGSEWEQAKFDELMTSRFANARPTVLTTNRDVSELMPRIRSRFEDRKLSRIAFDGAGDYRKIQRKML